MGIIDYIKKIINNGKKNAQIYATTLKKTYNTQDQLEIGLYDNKTPIANNKITININGKDYTRTTDTNGIAKLNINLPVGSYQAYIKFHSENYNDVTTYTDVIIATDTYIDGINLTKNEGDTTPYQCAVYRQDTNQRIKDEVTLTINGVPYVRTADNEGLYKLNINLNKGTYTLTAEYKGNTTFNPSSITNTITINEKPKPTPTPPQPTKLYPYITTQGGGKLGQRTGYTCGPHSLMQCIYRLTGIELSEMELASVCGTTTSGTGHAGLQTGLAWFNRKYNYNLKMKWYNFSEIGFDGLQKAYENGAVFLHLNYRNQWGHYEVPLTSNTDPNKILNSLGTQYSGGYYGYIEPRNKSTQQSYINGISQKSVCIMTR